MMHKLSYDAVSKLFKDQGCELLDDKYINNSTPVSFRCSCGDVSKISVANFKKGSRCMSCGTRKASAKKSHDIDYVRKCFEDQKCVLLEESYINNYTPMKYRCSCGNESVIRFFCLLKGQRCEACDGGRGETHYNWNPDRVQVERNLRFRRRQRALLTSVLFALGKSKRYKAAEILGYTSQELKVHIMSHKNWEKVKDGVWHIDHIFPVKAFLDAKIDDVKLINCLGNLQPLSGSDNLRKNAKYNRKEFFEWLVKMKDEMSL
jgi:hypothetical protein